MLFPYSKINGDGETNVLGDFVKLPNLNISSSISPNADWGKSSLHKPMVKKQVRTFFYVLPTRFYYVLLSHPFSECLIYFLLNHF